MFKNKNPKPKHKILKYLLITLAAIFSLLLVMAVEAIVRLYHVDGKPLPETPEKFITASPVNLEQIVGMSKYRSCQGHDNSAKGASGQIENNRSMKHYIVPRADIKEQLGVIEIFAPFDGIIALSMPGWKGREMILAPDVNERWGFLIFHIDPVEGVGNGAKIKAGQLIGHANVKDRHDFDLGLTYTYSSITIEKLLSLVRDTPHFPFPKSNYLVSPFDYMDDGVLQKFKDAGFDPNQMQFTKEERDQKPCNYDSPKLDDADWQYLPGQNPKEIQLQQEELQQPQNQTPPQLYP